MKRSGWGPGFVILAVMLASSVTVLPARADPLPTAPTPPVLTLEAAVGFALEHNPQLVAVRTQRGFAAGGVVVARTYPYNPVLNSVVLSANGVDITNRVFNEHYVTLQLEIRGQGKQRRTMAGAAVTRTEWEIAVQEVTTAVAVIRAYNAVLYRQQKLQILEETVRLNEIVVKEGQRLVEFGRLRAADLILARTELDAARAGRGQGRAALAVARSDLRRLLGTLDDAFVVDGRLDLAVPPVDPEALVRDALGIHPDVHARSAAVAEAEARLRLQIADRFGNPTVGPRYEYNETRDSFYGVVLSAPIPVLNIRQGEILQRRAEVARAQADLQASEFQVAQAVRAALARLAEARRWANEYPAEVLPNLERARQDLERLFAQNEQGVDVLRVISVQRNLLRATDAYLDARFEVSQANADLAAAVGDPALATGCYQIAGPLAPQGPPAHQP